MWYPLTRPESSWWSVGQQEMEAWLEQVRTQLTEYDDTLTRKFIEQITVVDAETIRV